MCTTSSWIKRLLSKNTLKCWKKLNCIQISTFLQMKLQTKRLRRFSHTCILTQVVCPPGLWFTSFMTLSRESQLSVIGYRCRLIIGIRKLHSVVQASSYFSGLGYSLIEWFRLPVQAYHRHRQACPASVPPKSISSGSTSSSFPSFQASSDRQHLLNGSRGSGYLTWASKALMAKFATNRNPTTIWCMEAGHAEFVRRKNIRKRKSRWQLDSVSAQFIGLVSVLVQFMYLIDLVLC